MTTSDSNWQPVQKPVPTHVPQDNMMLDHPLGSGGSRSFYKLPPDARRHILDLYHWPPPPPPWRRFGPTNISGAVTCLAVHSSLESTVYAGSNNGGVWRTTDGGVNWESLMQSEHSLAIGGLAVARSNPDIIYAATGIDDPGDWTHEFPGVGVYKSIDAGLSWSLTASIPSTNCSRVVVHPGDPNTVYVAGANGLHKTTDGGVNWTSVRTDHVTDVALSPLSPDHVYAAVFDPATGGVYLSTNGGVSWNLLSDGVIPTGMAADWIKISIGPLAFPGANDYIAAKLGPLGDQIYYSNDGGTNWYLIPGNHGAGDGTGDYWSSTIAINPVEDDILVGGVGLDCITLGGYTVGGFADTTHPDHHDLVYSLSRPNVCYAATDGGVFRSSDNGHTWSPASGGLVNTEFYSLGVSQKSPFLIGGATQDQGIILSSGSPVWTSTKAGNEGGFFHVDPNNSNNLYARPWQPGVPVKSTDGGFTWQPIPTGLGTAWIWRLAVQPGDSNHLLCVGGQQIFLSTNQGGRWSSVYTSPSADVANVAFSFSNPGICYATTTDGRILRSSAGGGAGSWYEPYSPTHSHPLDAIAIGGLAVSWTNPDFIYVAGTVTSISQVFYSRDGGASWSNASGLATGMTVPNVGLNSLAVSHYSPATVFLATEIGVYWSNNTGDSWQLFGSGLPSPIRCVELALDTDSHTLWVATYGRGVYMYSL